MPAAHHQAPYHLGDGLTVTGWSTDGEVTEALEVDGHRFGVGVQWHPEEGDDPRLITAFVEAAAQPRPAARRASRRPAQAGRGEATGGQPPLGAGSRERRSTPPFGSMPSGARDGGSSAVAKSACCSR